MTERGGRQASDLGLSDLEGLEVCGSEASQGPKPREV
jgi:hypothetical protein